MEKKFKRLGDAELEIMQVIWAAGEPVNSAHIQTAMQGKRGWALPTLLTALSRLCEKGFLTSEKQGRNNFYTASVGEAEYQRSEGKTILEKLYGNSVTGLMAALYDGKSIEKKDLDELQKFLDERRETG